MMTMLNRIALNYITPKFCFLAIIEFSKTPETGGYDILEIPLCFQSLDKTNLPKLFL